MKEVAPSITELSQMTDAELLDAGCVRWDEPNEQGQTLWLFPREWYASIQEGAPVVDIFYNRETFERGVTDDDYRGGMLSFGILIPSVAPNRDVASMGLQAER